MKCMIDGRKCEDYFPEYDGTPDCPFGMYHDRSYVSPNEQGATYGLYDDTCIFAKERRLPPKELRDRPLFSWRQIRVMLNQLNEEANDVGPVERDV